MNILFYHLFSSLAYRKYYVCYYIFFCSGLHNLLLKHPLVLLCFFIKVLVSQRKPDIYRIMPPVKFGSYLDIPSGETQLWRERRLDFKGGDIWVPGKLLNISWDLKYFIGKSLDNKEYLTCQESLLRSLQNLTSMTKICSSLASSRREVFAKVKVNGEGFLCSFTLHHRAPDDWSWRLSFTTGQAYFSTK